ncbi:hypothetical protein [Tardiphaga robiniae]|nr:hypothetical protein [Tardiphaga robiniae]
MLARQIAIGFGIAIILPLLIHYGVATFHPAPKYQAFVTLRPAPPAGATADERKEYAEQQRQRQDAFAEAARQFSRVLAIVSTPLGVAAIFIGAYLSFQAIGTGLILGGILSVGWGYWSYWSYLDDWIRFVSLLAGFAILVFVGVKRGSTRALSQKHGE